VHQDGLQIGQLAKLVGTSTSALRYYEDAGLLEPAMRTQSGYRIYPAAAVGRLQFLNRAKALGLSLSEIRQLVESPASDAEVQRERLRHVVAHRLADTKSRMVELQALELELERLYIRLLRPLGPDCGHIGDCACWLPTDEEVKSMTQEVVCCGELCCPDCSCTNGGPCDCPDCPCKTGKGAVTKATKASGPIIVVQPLSAKRAGD
jgi:MerR family Zn(II)-responsive transcriptional regulator of zntA